MIHTVKMVSGGMIYWYIPDFMTTGSGFQVISGCYSNNLRGSNVGISGGGVVRFSVEIASCGVIYIPRFITIGSGMQIILMLLPQQYERLVLLMRGIYEVHH
jgi:hypothetical protein